MVERDISFEGRAVERHLTVADLHYLRLGAVAELVWIRRELKRETEPARRESLKAWEAAYSKHLKQLDEKIIKRSCPSPALVG